MATTTSDEVRVSRLARAVASPAGILIVVPVLVAAAGLVVLLLGRDATRGVSTSMARSQLADQAASVEREFAFALDQAGPMLERLRALVLAPGEPTVEELAPRLVDIMVGRAGVANVSLSYPAGVLRGTFLADGDQVRVQESRVGADGTVRRNFAVEGGVARLLEESRTTYDPRTRGHYTQAVAARARGWTAPRVFFSSKSTGLTCTEPVYDPAGSLRAVITVDFDVGALSRFIARPPLPGARTLVFAADRAILAYPDERAPPLPADGRLLQPADLHDPAVDALFAALDRAGWPRGLTYYALGDGGGGTLASIAPIGGVRAGVPTSLDWYVATLVPEQTLLGPTRRLERRSLIASALALTIAIAVAAFFAWYVVRMRQAVATSRARARSAEQRARELGSYRLVGRLGVGGMGEVWRAEHRLLARQAAIKMIRPDAVVGDAADQARERFRREAQTLAAMRSRHTIELYDYGVTDDGTFFYVMELLDGQDLQTLVQRHGPQPAARVIHFLVGALGSLAEAHAAGLLHRDIKPANLFSCRAADEVDLIKVLDFGIVHAGDGSDAGQAALAIEVVSLPAPGREPAPGQSGPRLTQGGAVLGTPGYMAPEQASGKALDPRSDLYALGCVAWWLLTGQELFVGGNDLVTLFNHVHQPPPPLRPLVTGWLPDELAALVLACLGKRPDDRPASARALATALRAIHVPPEEAWTDQRAHAWWSAHQPGGPGEAGPSAAPASSRWLVPKATDDAR